MQRHCCPTDVILGDVTTGVASAAAAAAATPARRPAPRVQSSRITRGVDCHDRFRFARYKLLAARNLRRPEPLQITDSSTPPPSPPTPRRSR